MYNSKRNVYTSSYRAPYSNGSTGYNSSNRYSNSSQSQMQRPKKSGAKFFETKQGYHGFNAWVKTTQGLLKISAFGRSTCKGKNHTFEVAVCTVVNLASGQTSLYNVLIDVTTMRCPIKELNLLVTKAGGGRTASGRNVTGAVVSLVKR